MCGIVGIYRKTGLTVDDLKRFTEMLTRCQSRGFDATGIFNGNMNILKAGIQSAVFIKAKKYGDFIEKSVGCKYIIGHCRSATRGSPKDNKNNHPVPVIDNGERVYIVHNGMVECSKWDTDPNKGKKELEIVDTYIFANAIKTFWTESSPETKSLYISTKLACEDIQRSSRSESSVIVVGNSKEIVVCKSHSKPLTFQVMDDGNAIIIASTEMILRPEKTKMTNGKSARIYKTVCDYSIVGIDVESGSIKEELLSTIPKQVPTVEYIDYEPEFDNESIIVINKGRQTTLTGLSTDLSFQRRGMIDSTYPLPKSVRNRLRKGRVDVAEIDDWDREDDEIIEDRDADSNEKTCFHCTQSYRGYTEDEILILIKEKRIGCTTYGEDVSFSQSRKCVYFEHE